MKKLIKDNKRGIILTAAIVLPFGFVALGAWKAYELYKGKKYVEDLKLSRVDPRDFLGFPTIDGPQQKSSEAVRGQQDT